jgi:hypothetical protein
MSQVKVTNKTKGAKGVLAQFRLVDVDLVVCGQVISAGQSIVVPTEDWELQKASHARLVKLGALEAGDVPETVLAPTPGPALVRTRSERKKDESPSEG